MKFAVLLLACCAAAQEAKVDAIFQEWNQPNSPGAAVAVMQDGKLVFSKGYGIANLEYGIPIKPDTVFHVASVSKQFTAMALVLLEARDRLSLEDDVHKYLPELPAYGQKITIRHLLQHTSGIRDQWQTLALAGWRIDDVITQKQILRVLFRQRELNFPAGTEHLYSNGGYTLAAEIVARVSGKSFPEFCREAIFEPLGMKSTHFHDDHTHVDRNRAYSYSSGSGHWNAAPLNYANAGATSLFTTAPDLALWLDNFRTSKVGSVARLQEQAVLQDGRRIDYALGVTVANERGLKAISHAGGDAGYRSFVVYYPERRLGVVVLSNSGWFNPVATAHRVADVFLGERARQTQAVAPERTFVAVDSSVLPRYEGIYMIAGGLLVEVAKRGDKLMASAAGQPTSELKPLAEDRFWVDSLSAELHFAERGKVVVTQRGVFSNGTRLDSRKPGASDLPEFTGAYWSEELETQYTISVRDAKLHAEHIRHGDFSFTPAARDYFTGGQWFFSQMRFTRGPNGTIDGFFAGGGRVRGIRFVRR